MSSSHSGDDDDEREFSDSTDYDDYETTDDEFDFEMNSNEEDEDDEEEEDSPIHFRECLRLLDAALTISSSNSSILPSWCASGSLGVIDDPMILINGCRRTLNLPMNKREAKRMLNKAEPFEMKIDLIDEEFFDSSAFCLSSDSFRLTNSKWKTNVEPILKEFCVGKNLQLDSNDFDLKISQLILLDSSPFPRRFKWKSERSTTIGKLLVTLPSTYKNGKETISLHKEKHSFDLTDVDRHSSTFFTVVPLTNEIQHEIDLISSGTKLILVYDVIQLKSTTCFNVEIDETQVERVKKVLNVWSEGLKEYSTGYSTKIVLPWTETFEMGKNPLISPVDRLIGSILRRTLDEKFYLYRGVVKPNRSSDGTVHACRILTQLERIRSDSKSKTIFDSIESVEGNCNETFSGNIFLRRKRLENGNFVTSEQFSVPIWCLVSFEHRFDLFIDNLSRLTTFLDENPDEIFALIDWIFVTTKKIEFNWKTLLHQLVRLYSNENLHLRLNSTIEKIFQHRKFIEQFFPMENRRDYENLIFLLKNSFDSKIEIHFEKLFAEVLSRRTRDADRFREAMKLIGIFSTEKINENFLFSLIQKVLNEIFSSNRSSPSITDLTNLLALLAVLNDAYEPSCQILVQQLVRQMKISSTTTTNSSLITNFLRTVLVPTLIEISKHYVERDDDSKRINFKRKRENNVEFPSWFVELYQTCLTCLNNFSNDSLPIPFYSNLSNLLHSCQCSHCQQLFAFLRNETLFEQIFFIPTEHYSHFNAMTTKFDPLFIVSRSISSNDDSQRIHLMKISKYDEEFWRENHLLRSLLSYIPIDQQSDSKSVKRFKCS